MNYRRQERCKLPCSFAKKFKYAGKKELKVHGIQEQQSGTEETWDGHASSRIIHTGDLSKIYRLAY